MAKPKQPRPVTVDFETMGIEGRPIYPPVPVGVSIKYFGKASHYYAWGHIIGNNCSIGEAIEALKLAWAHEEGVLFQNGKFDVDVAEAHLDLPRLPWSNYHDTMFLLFLDDPHATSHALKPSAERLLGMPPDEQDAVGAWLVANQPVPGVKISLSQKSDNYFGKYIAFAPGDLVGKYADGDVIRTEKLFNHLWPSIAKRGMLVAYDRERRLMPILMEIERQGIRVDVERLRDDCANYDKLRTHWLEPWIIRQLKIKDPLLFNMDSGPQLVEALIAAGKVDMEKLGVTPKGATRTDKESLASAITDPVLAGVLQYRTQLGTCLKTFMMSWLQTAENSGGLIFTRWNQCRSYGGGGDQTGARTGRLSSSPNFQNIPKEFEPAFKELAKIAYDNTPISDKDERASLLKLTKSLPKSPFPIPPLPQVRSYVIPWDETHILLDRDYSQQELRILGHFEGATLLDKYIENPHMDIHDEATTLINNMLHTTYTRKPIKNTGFGLIYGMGLGKLAAKSKISVDEAKKVKNAYLAIFPGLKDMYSSMKQRATDNEPIRTWGGREYYCEPPAMVDGRLQTFDYKMVNVLIQGSAADCTKEAIIRFYDACIPKIEGVKFYLSVHDEILLSCQVEVADEVMLKLKEIMEGIEFDVMMLSDGKRGDRWDHLVKVNEIGE